MGVFGDFTGPFLHNRTDKGTAKHSPPYSLAFYKCDQCSCYGPNATLSSRKDTLIKHTGTVSLSHYQHNVFAIQDIILLQLSTTVILIYGGHCSAH